MTLISSDNVFLLAAVVFGGAAFAYWAERQRWGRQVSGPVWAILVGLALSNLRIVPMNNAAFALVNDFLVPAAIPLLLFKADLRRIVAEGGPMLAAFFIGVAGATAGAILGFYLLPLGGESAELAGVFTATYTGGSMNFVAVARAVGFDGSSQYAAAMAADNLVGTPYLLLLIAIPAIGWVRRHFPSQLIGDGQGAPKPVAAGPEVEGFDFLQISAALALSLGVCALGTVLAVQFGVERLAILFITAVAVAVANLAPRRMAALKGDFELGTLFMYLFFVTIGASANLLELAGEAMILVPYAMLIIACHLLVLMAGVKALKIDLAEALVASNACIMGPATAAAIAAGQGWRDLVTPGVLIGVLGYVIANFLGVAVTGLLS